MGDDQGIVALSGAHALGRCHADASGFVGPWTPTPTTFNNLYFKLLKNSNWEEGCIKGETCKNPQYRDAASQQFMMLPTDTALLKDSSFKKYVDLYADDQKVFFQVFSKCFKSFKATVALDHMLPWVLVFLGTFKQSLPSCRVASRALCLFSSRLCYTHEEIPVWYASGAADPLLRAVYRFINSSCEGQG